MTPEFWDSSSVHELMNAREPYKLLLPLWRRVVFVDWFGVLSTSLFWHSILDNPSHPYYQRLRHASEALFTFNADVVRAWMRGEVSAETIISCLRIDLDRRSKPDFLLRRLHKDCHNTLYRAELLRAIRIAVDSAYIVIATDNMDCFCRQIQQIPGVMDCVDDILSSSNLGVLKMEDVGAFFGPWLSDHDLSFEASLLIDDNAKTCDAFRSRGGAAVMFRSADDALVEVCDWAKCSEESRVNALCAAQRMQTNRGVPNHQGSQNEHVRGSEMHQLQFDFPGR